MTDRVARLRRRSLETKPWLSIERARLMTEFYRQAEPMSEPMLRARALSYLMDRKTVSIGPDELIVGERGPEPKGTPTFPELCCHSLEDFEVLNSRQKISYRVDGEARRIQADEIIPFWRGRSIRDRIFREMTPAWKDCYEAGLYTEFMEQRAPGHTVLGDVIYRKGLLDLKEDVESSLARLDWGNDPDAYDKEQELKAMAVAADAVMRFAERHAEKAREMAAAEPDPRRKAELERVAEVCSRVPAHAPRDFWEALQSYWFVHLGVVTELNTWDSFCPGRLDQHLNPFYQKGLAESTLTREQAQELLQCFWVKFNNQPAPPKVGVTAAESGTYTDFANINNGGLARDGSCGVNDVTYLILDVIDEMRLLQPSSNLQLSKKNPDRFLKRGLEIVRQGWGQPSIFNADLVVEELLRQGKSIEDARCGGTSGCVETGAFGKEAYILTGYFNLPKVLEITLNNGVDPRTGKRIGLETGEPEAFASYDELFAAFRRQLHHFIDIKVRGNQVIERLYARHMPAPFLSILIDGCIEKGKDYNDGGPRYNTTYIMGVAPGTCTDCLSALKYHVFERKTLSMHELSAGPGRQLRGPREDAPAALESNAQVRQRRRLCRRHSRRRLRCILFRSQRPEEHQRRLLSRELPLDHLSRVLRLGHRGNARRAQSLGAPFRRHLPGAGSGPQGAHRGHPVGREDGSRPHGRHAAQPEVHAAGPGRGRRPRPFGPVGAVLLQDGRAPHSVQRRHRRDAEGRAEGAG